jgi:hypothetical protein
MVISVPDGFAAGKKNINKGLTGMGAVGIVFPSVDGNLFLKIMIEISAGFRKEIRQCPPASKGRAMIPVR